MNKRFPDNRAVIDLMLAHSPKDRIEAAYNRAERLRGSAAREMPRRRELVQLWADLLLDGAAPAEALLEGPRKILHPACGQGRGCAAK